MDYNTANRRQKREKIQALSLAKECYSMKMDLLTNATVVDDAIRFLSGKSKGNVKSSSEGDKESNKNDHNEDKKLEEQQQKGDCISTNNIIF
jgi:hypothetical protein